MPRPLIPPATRSFRSTLFRNGIFILVFVGSLGIAEGFPLQDSASTNNYHSDSINLKTERMGLFDMNFGTTFRTAARASETIPDQRQTNSAFGLSGRMQSSILWSLRSTSLKKHRFTWGDILAAEVFAGKLSSVQQHESGNVWLAYQFDFGFGGRYAINDHSEVGLNLILLRFSRDNVSGNISGSGLVGRYRYKKIMLEAGAIARHERALGVLTDARDKVPMQGTWTLRYLVNGGKNFGVTAETLSGIYHQDEFQYSKMWTLKIFYGIYF